MRQKFTNRFSTAKSARRKDRKKENIKLSSDAAQDVIIVRNNQGSHELRIQFNTVSRPLLENSRGRFLAMRGLVLEPSDDFPSEAPVAQLLEGRKSQFMSAGNMRRRVIIHRKLTSVSKEAERWAYLLLYPHENFHGPYDMATYVRERDANLGG